MPRLSLFSALLILAVAAPTSLLAQHHKERDHDRDEDDDDMRRSQIDTTLNLDKNGTVDLAIVSGRISVTNWNRSDVKVRATSEHGLFRLDASPSRMALSVRSEHGSMGETEFDITIPVGARLVARSVSGDIDTRGGSEVEVHSVNGDVVVLDVGGRATLESVSGDVKAERIGGPVRANNVSGSLSVRGVGGDVEAETVSGDITFEDVRAKFARASTVSGTVAFSGSIDPAGRYEFHSHSGDLQLRLAQPINATVSVETFSGDVDSTCPMTLMPSGDAARSHSGKRMEFKLGNGGARITAQTFSGDITIGGPGGRTACKE